jgi:dTDP-glucose 4,6-dehydratase
MKILVTGGAGFIGTNFIRYLFAHHPEDEIICLDKLTYAGKYENIAPFIHQPNFFFEKTDICDREAVFSVFKKYNPDAVVHFAAESHVDRSLAEPDLFLKTNILGTGVMLDAVNHFGTKRFHQISTDEVYGDLPLERKDLLFSENSPLKPSSPYSVSKTSADLLVLSYFRTFGTPVTISRCSNNYGPYQFPEKLIPLMITNAKNDRPLPVYGDGLNVRDWIYVDDHCEAVDRILRNGTCGEIYNVGGNCEISNIDLVRMILKILGKPESLITFVPDRKGHDRRYAICSEKLRKELGWIPETAFSEGLQKTITWYL